MRAREHADIAHAHHGRCEVGAELSGTGRVGADKGVGGSAVEELLVGVEEPLLRDQVAVVSIVEGVGGRHVKRREVAVAAGLRAVGLQ